MKNTLIAALLISVAGFASAQTAASSAVVAPKVGADRAVTAGARADLRTDEANRKAELAQTKADRASGNMGAVKTDEAAHKADTAAMTADKATVAADKHTTVHQRVKNNRRQARDAAKAQQ